MLKREVWSRDARTATGERPLVLYVEDDDPSWEITEIALRDRYRVLRASSSSEAFAVLAEESTLRLVLLDIELAGSLQDGMQIAATLRDPEWGNRDFVLIFVTAYRERHPRSALIRAGGDEVVYKPVDLVKLSGALARYHVRDVIG